MSLNVFINARDKTIVHALHVHPDDKHEQRRMFKMAKQYEQENHVRLWRVVVEGNICSLVSPTEMS